MEFNQNITPEAVRIRALELCKANRDTVYGSPRFAGGMCSYLKGDAAGRKGCLFGQALSDLGATQEELLNLEGTSIQGWWDHQGTVFDTAIVMWLSCAQSSQDSGDSWGSLVGMITNGGED